MASLRMLTMEEMYELLEAVDRQDMPMLREELGDVLVHVLFYCSLAAEQGAFDLKQVLDTCCEKLIRRHPHIYGSVQVSTADEVKKNWEQLKIAEGKTSVLDGVPQALPAMAKAYRIQDKARQVGFDWQQWQGVWEKVLEEVNELKAMVQRWAEQPDQIQGLQAELGDLFFALINFARFTGVDPEAALQRTNQKFIDRFRWMETEASQKHHQPATLTAAQWDALWEAAKKHFP